MKILALEQEAPGLSPDHFEPFLRTEAHRVWELYKAGLIRELYFDRQQHTAVLVLETNSLVEAEKILASLPLVQAGLISFRLIELAPYSGFERLFSLETKL